MVPIVSSLTLTQPECQLIDASPLTTFHGIETLRENESFDRGYFVQKKRKEKKNQTKITPVAVLAR